MMIRLINRLLKSSSEEDIYKIFAASCDCLFRRYKHYSIFSYTVYGCLFKVADEISSSHKRVKVP